MSTVLNLKEKVGEYIINASSSIFDGVVETLANEEIRKRTDLVLQTIKKINEIKSDLAKIKPDNTSYDIEGKILQQSYTKDTLEKKKKLTEHHDKLSNALDKAFNETDFSKLKDVNSQ